MTIDEAISHAREVAENDGCTNCAAEHEQLAMWLEELKELRKMRETINYHSTKPYFTLENVEILVDNVAREMT